MKIILTRVLRKDKDKNGKPYINKNGNPYERLGIQGDTEISKYKGEWLSGFSGEWNRDWKEGDAVDINIEEVQKDGKTYFNFSKVDRIDELEARIEILENYVLGGGKQAADADPQENPDDIPF